MRRSILLLAYLLLASCAIGAEAPKSAPKSVAKPAVTKPAAKPAAKSTALPTKPTVDDLIKELDARSEELKKRAVQLDTQAKQLAADRLALTKDKNTANDAIKAAVADRAKVTTLQAAVEDEKKKLNAAQTTIEAEKKALESLRAEIEAERAAITKEQEKLAAFAAELEKAGTTNGEMALAVVDGPEEAEAGTLVVLDASGSNAAAFMWTADNLTKEQYDVDSSTQQLYFACPCDDGQYKFVLSVALDNTVDALIHTVTVGNAPEPTPEPEPEPEPDPEPVPLTGFPREIYDWVIELVPSEVQEKPAIAFHKNYMVVAAKIEAGVLNDIEKADWEITKLNRNAVDGEIREQWMAFFERLKERFEKLEKDGELKTVKDVSKLFQEIAKGLIPWVQIQENK